MTVTWLLTAEKTNTFPKKVLYWGGESWVEQVWDADHFESVDEVNRFMIDRCDLNKKSGWIFGVMPIDSGMDF